MDTEGEIWEHSWGGHLEIPYVHVLTVCKATIIDLKHKNVTSPDACKKFWS